jgi:hypothetical protein
VKDTQDKHIGMGINFFTIIHRMRIVGIGNEQELEKKTTPFCCHQNWFDPPTLQAANKDKVLTCNTERRKNLERGKKDGSVI